MCTPIRICVSYRKVSAKYNKLKLGRKYKHRAPHQASGSIKPRIGGWKQFEANAIDKGGPEIYMDPRRRQTCILAGKCLEPQSRPAANDKTYWARTLMGRVRGHGH